MGATDLAVFSPQKATQSSEHFVSGAPGKSVVSHQKGPVGRKV